MKKIEAVIRPTKLEPLKEALDAIDVRGMTVYEVMGRGMQKGQTQYYRGQAHFKDLLEKMKIEIVCADERVDKIIGTIIEVCKTGKAGDGKIFIYPVEKIIRIRTGESGDPAI